ncbi:unnamed protein product, partial [Iphiclides podalirius]
MRSSRHDLERLIILAQIDGKRARGRAPARWSDAVEGAVGRNGLSMSRMIELVGDIMFVVTILSRRRREDKELYRVYPYLVPVNISDFKRFPSEGVELTGICLTKFTKYNFDKIVRVAEEYDAHVLLIRRVRTDWRWRAPGRASCRAAGTQGHAPRAANAYLTL